MLDRMVEKAREKEVFSREVAFWRSLLFIRNDRFGNIKCGFGQFDKPALNHITGFRPVRYVC
jgi:hypothetical protein